MNDERLPIDDLIEAADGEIKVIDLSKTPLGPLFDPNVDFRKYVESQDNYKSMKEWITAHLSQPLIKE